MTHPNATSMVVFRQLLVGAVMALPAAVACGGAGSPSASVSAATACRDYVAAFESECGRTSLGGLSATQCEVTTSLPGAPSADSVEACAAAIVRDRCWNFAAIAECRGQGALAANVDCNQNAQCQSGSCSAVAPSCGVCAPVIADGHPCQTGGGCRFGALCSGGVCTAVTRGGGGAQCDSTTALCADGFYCGSQGTCTPLAALGGACSTAISPFGPWNTCAAPYICDATSGTCVAGNGVGAPCPCLSGLVCAYDSSGTRACALPAAGGPPGAACDNLTTFCAVGSCDATTKSCPSIVADGKPCSTSDASQTCGSSSTCSNGTCVSVVSTVAICR